MPIKGKQIIDNSIEQEKLIILTPTEDTDISSKSYVDDNKYNEKNSIKNKSFNSFDTNLSQTSVRISEGLDEQPVSGTSIDVYLNGQHVPIGAYENAYGYFSPTIDGSVKRINGLIREGDYLFWDVQKSKIDLTTVDELSYKYIISNNPIKTIIPNEIVFIDENNNIYNFDGITDDIATINLFSRDFIIGIVDSGGDKFVWDIGGADEHTFTSQYENFTFTFNNFYITITYDGINSDGEYMFSVYSVISLDDVLEIEITLNTNHDFLVETDGSYIDWGDGSNISYINEPLTHRYSPGVYRLRVTNYNGTYLRFSNEDYYLDYGIIDNITIENFGGNYTNLNHLFFYYTGTNIIFNTSDWSGCETVLSLDYSFEGCNITSLPPSWNGLSSLETMVSTFYYNLNLLTIPTSWTGLSSLRIMMNTFEECVKLTNVPTSWSGLTSIESMSGLFYNSPLIQNAPLTWAGLPTSLTDISYLFFGCIALTDIPPNWDNLTNVININSIFSYCSISSIPLSWSGLENVEDLSGAFNGCELLTTIPTTWTNLNSLIDMGSAFRSCTSLTTIPISWAGLENVENVNNLFFGCELLEIIPTTWTGLSNITNASYMFRDCRALSNIPSSWSGLSLIENALGMFVNCKSLSSIPTTWTGLETLISLNAMFSGCSRFTTIPSNWTELSNVETLSQAFYDCTSLTSIPSSWSGLEGATTLYRTFYNCTSLRGNVPSNITVLNNLTDVRQTFQNCNELGTTDGETATLNCPDYWNQYTTNTNYGDCFTNANFLNQSDVVTNGWATS